MTYNVFNPEPWAADATVNCAPTPSMTPKEIGAFADQFHPSPAREAMATFLCAGCPRIAECAEYAMTARDAQGQPIEGVWGGTTTAERAARRRSKAAA